jgi:hypothetical protein
MNETVKRWPFLMHDILIEGTAQRGRSSSCRDIISMDVEDIILTLGGTFPVIACTRARNLDSRKDKPS